MKSRAGVILSSIIVFAVLAGAAVALTGNPSQPEVDAAPVRTWAGTPAEAGFPDLEPSEPSGIVTLIDVPGIDGTSRAFESITDQLTISEGSTTTSSSSSTTTTVPLTTTTTTTVPPTTTTVAPTTTTVAPTTTTVAPTTTTTVPTGGSFSPASESDFVARINDLRASLDLPALVVDGSLRSYARDWSEHMADVDTLFHSDLSCDCSSENVGYGPNVSILFDALVASPGHYNNMINPAWNRLGVGVWITDGGTMWTTHNFGV